MSPKNIGGGGGGGGGISLTIGVNKEKKYRKRLSEYRNFYFSVIKPRER